MHRRITYHHDINNGFFFALHRGITNRLVVELRPECGDYPCAPTVVVVAYPCAFEIA
jgi:hypothetical protein